MRGSRISRSIGNWELSTAQKRDTSTCTINCGIADGLKKAGQVLSFVEPAAFQCTNSRSLVIRFTDTQICRWLLLTKLSIKFSGECRLTQPQVVYAIGAMSDLRCLELTGVPSPDTFYGTLTRHSRFTLDSFGCDSDITENLLDFLDTQPHLSECTMLSNPKHPVPWQPCHRAQPLLSYVVLLRTTAHLLNYTQLDLSSLRRLEYIGDSLDLGHQIAAVDRICQLGAQLETLRIKWGTGKVGTFLDVTKFFKIAICTPALRYLQLVHIDKDAFEQFVDHGLRAKQWSNLITLVWIPPIPWTSETDIDMLSPDDRLVVTIPTLHELWGSLNPSYSSLCTADRDFRLHHIGRELMNANSSMRRFGIWNWSRMGYDMLIKDSDSVGRWSYGVDLREDEWMTTRHQA